MRINDRVALAALAAVAVIGWCPAAARAADDLAPALSTVGARPARDGGVWQAAGAFRLALVRDRGYDPFSANDVLPQVSLSLTRALGRGPGLSPAVGLVWENGGASAGARGTEAALSLQRLAVVLEARFAPRRDIYLAARLAPGVLFASASLTDPSTPVPLETSYRVPSVDGSFGVAARVNPEANTVGFWLLADGGYGWTPSHDLVLTPRLPVADRDKAGTTSLGALSTRGAFLRLGLALSY